MNELKFRVHHPDSGWKYFDFNLVKACCVMFDDGDWRPLKDCEVMQFTTRHDKNEKEIYGGDIVKGKDLTGVVEYYLDGFRIYSSSMSEGLADWGFSEREVIGNVIDNPELLNAETESK